MNSINWEFINNLRKENENNPNYPLVYWEDINKKLYVRIGDKEYHDLTKEEALNLFKDNELFLYEYHYLVDDNINEETITLFDENDSISQDNNQTIDIDKIKIEIEEEIENVIKKLGLEKSTDAIIQLKNCCKVQKYIVENNNYNNDIMIEKESYSDKDIRTIDLYNGLVKHSAVCTSNSIAFQEILERVGVNASCVGLTSKEGGFHMANLVELDGEYYFFDTTLEKTIYDNFKDTNNDLILCCAGLGKDDYCEYYEPKAIMPKNPLDALSPIPNNIANKRIPQEIIQMQITDAEYSK